MSQFSTFVTTAAAQAAAVMGESVNILATSETVTAIFDEEVMDVETTYTGDRERVVVQCSIPKNGVTIPPHNSRVLRVQTNVTYLIQSVNITLGHYDLTLYREGDKIGNG